MQNLAVLVAAAALVLVVVVSATAMVVVFVPVVLVAAVAIVAVFVAEAFGFEEGNVEAAAEILGAAGNPGAEKAVGVEDEAVHRGEGRKQAAGGSDGGEVLLEDLGEARAGVVAEERGGVGRERRAGDGADVAVVELREARGGVRTPPRDRDARLLEAVADGRHDGLRGHRVRLEEGEGAVTHRRRPPRAGAGGG